MARHWERTLIVLGICLPVPLLALTGLAIPLPATVERIAAALVPWAETSAALDNDALPSGVDGVIVRTADEGHQTVVIPVAASNPHSEAPPTAGADDGKGGSNGGGGRDGDDGSGGGSGGGSVGGSGSGGGGGGGGGTGQDPGGEDPGEEPDPVQDVVDDVEETVDPVVDETTDTVGDVVDSTGLEETVDSVLPDLGE
jgi:hypothetical protein